VRSFIDLINENSYRGDGSPGMVMGIASDARSDTNTYEADEINTSMDIKELKKLSGLEADLDEARKKRPDEEDDWDEEDEKPEDPEADKVPHFVMQLRKALDVDGNYEIKFADGSKHKLPMKDITAFMEMYSLVKPLDKEKMQDVAIMSKDNFDKIVSFFKPEHGPREKSLYDR